MMNDSITAAQVIKLSRAREIAPNQWVADCIAHPDTQQSLLIGSDNGRLLLRCKKGCDFLTLLFAIKARLRAPMNEGAPHETHSVV
jgi:hypothetical protein